MNRKIIKTIFPAFAMLLAIGVAFGFKTSRHSNATLYSGHKKVGVNCVDTGIICTDDGGSVICKDGSNNTLYRFLSATNCPQQLWRAMPQ